MSHDKPSLVQSLIQFNSCYCGLNLKAVPLPPDCHCLGIVRQGAVILLNENPKIACGDYILAVAVHPSKRPELLVSLKKTHPVLWSSFRTHVPPHPSDFINNFSLTNLCYKD